MQQAGARVSSARSIMCALSQVKGLRGARPSRGAASASLAANPLIASAFGLLP